MKKCTICGDDDMGACTPAANCLNVTMQQEKDGEYLQKGGTADLHLKSDNSIDVHIFDICPDGEHAIVGNKYHPQEAFPVNISRLTPIAPLPISPTLNGRIS